MFRKGESIQVLMKQDEGAGAAGAAADAGGEKGAAGAKGSEEKFFTQDQLNKMLAENKRSLRLALEEKDKVINELHSKVGSFEERFESLSGTIEGLTKGDKANINIDKNKPLEEIIKEMGQKVAEYDDVIKNTNSQIEELGGRLEAEAALRELAEEESLISERDARLQRALSKTGCRDIDVGLKLFEDSCEVDEDTGEWYVVNDKTGEEWALEEGVEKLLPDYLRKPITEREGAGSGGSSRITLTEVQAKKNKASEINQRIVELKAEYSKDRDKNKLIEVQRLAKERHKLQLELRSQ